jgi:hypothetical protein
MSDPIACSLRPADHAERLRRLADLAERALVRREPLPGGERLVFADAPGVERDLRAAIAAEAACCPFLTLALERAEAGLVLDVTGPALARPIIAELFARCAAPGARPRTAGGTPG